MTRWIGWTDSDDYEVPIHYISDKGWGRSRSRWLGRWLPWRALCGERLATLTVRATATDDDTWCADCVAAEADCVAAEGEQT